MRPRPHIAIVGSGAVGSFVGAKLVCAGHRVTLIDPWPAHVQAIRNHGLTIVESGGEMVVACSAMHICDVQSLHREKVDLAFICVKLYDTRWVTELIVPYLTDDGAVVTLQNGLVESQVAEIAGHARTLGAIGSTMSVCLDGPGRVVRMQAPAGEGEAVFYVGEIDGPITERVSDVTRLLAHADRAVPTSNLLGERWAKLVANTMSGPVAALAGMTFRQVYETPQTRRIAVRLAGEAIRVGRTLGHRIGQVRGLSPDVWAAAAEGNAAALAELEAHLLRMQRVRPDNGRSAMAADLAAGRRTEVDELSGLVVRYARKVNVPAPTHAKVVSMIHAVGAGQAAPGAAMLAQLELADC